MKCKPEMHGEGVHWASGFVFSSTASGEQNETDSRQTAISHGGNDFVMQFNLGGDGVKTLVIVTI